MNNLLSTHVEELALRIDGIEPQPSPLEQQRNLVDTLYDLSDPCYGGKNQELAEDEKP